MIHFTIDGAAQTAEPGMTWSDWANSSYNTSYELGGGGLGSFPVQLNDKTLVPKGGSVTTDYIWSDQEVEAGEYELLAALINFTIQLDSYSTSDRPTIQLQAEEGMTLYEWANSSYFAPLTEYGYSLYSGSTPTGTFGLNNTKISFYLLIQIVGTSSQLRSDHVLTDGGSYKLF